MRAWLVSGQGIPAIGVSNRCVDCGGVGLINLGQWLRPKIAHFNTCGFAHCHHYDHHHHDLVAGCMCVSVVGSRAGVSFSSITHTTGHTNTIMARTMMVMSATMMMVMVMLLSAMMMSLLMKVSPTTMSSRVFIVALVT